MHEILNKVDCCGCSACFSACPTKAIEMRPDDEGFYYPTVIKELCINCQLCEKVCPMNVDVDTAPEQERKGYIVRSKNETVLMDSSSGGSFTPIARWIIQHGGIICAATYDKNKVVVHRLSEDIDSLPSFRGSKYVQSNMGSCFQQIKAELQTGRLIAFFGTTCQVYGLKQYLNKEYDNLFCVDLVCHGTPSPKLWEKYVKYHENKEKAPISNINFRSKKYGYHVGSLTLEFENGKRYCASARTDYMLRAFFSEIASRPSCYQCHFKTVNRCSDLTVYDAWHAAELNNKIKDDDKGFTHVIVHTASGHAMLREILDSIDVYEEDYKKAIELDGPMVEKSAVVHEKRNQFYAELDNYTLPRLIRIFVPIRFKDRAIDLFKAVVYKTPILKFIRVIRNRHRV